MDERTLPGESPRRYVTRLALAKARAVAERYPNRWVVGADTVVVVDGKLLGKPDGRRDAVRMLQRLSGRGHRVVSGIALAHRESGIARSAVSTTRVFFRRLTERDILRYVATGEPLDKAGAYAIQGRGGIFVERIEGSFSNVVGFPLEKFLELWKSRLKARPRPSS